MNAQQRVKQAQACHIRYKQLEREGVIAGDLPIYLYAEQILGHPVDSLKKLADCELNQLRDALEGRASKVEEKLRQLAQAAGILDLDRWIHAVAKSPRMAWLRGYSVQTLPSPKKWRLCQMLAARASTIAMAPENER